MMIRFSKQQLRIPKYMRPVYVVAGGNTDFRKHYPEKKTEELCVEAFRMMALENDLKVDSIQEVKDRIQMAVYGHFADHFGDQLLGEALIHDRLGLDPLPNFAVKTGGATGGSALFAGAMAVASGQVDGCLVMGWERMDEVPTKEGNHYISTAADKDYETELGHTYTGYYALMAQRYWKIFGKGSDAFRRTLAKISVKNHRYAYSNPFAQTHEKITVEDVIQSPIVADPLRFYDCCLMSVGASCALLCDEKTAYELTDTPARMWIAGGTHTLRTADRRHMAIPLLPNETEETYRNFEERYPGADLYPGFTSFLGARMAAYYVYGMAGIQNPVEDFDLVELHDAFTISDVQSYEDLGLRPYGQGADYIESGDAYLGGKCPSNLSGGLLGCMHSVGATGIMQVNECLWQLKGQWKKFHMTPGMWERFGKKMPADIENLQVKDPTCALAISHAGVGSHVTATVLKREV
jgi:acetyl-CoA C-acetyltransferase